MGLNIVELVMEIEETFSIRIPEDDAQQLPTVGDVFEYILTKTNLLKESSVCLSAVTFYSLRRAATELGFSKIRTCDPVQAILPSDRPAEYWNQLQRAVNLKLPSLQRPNWLINASALLVIAGALLMGLFAAEVSGFKYAFWIAVPITVIVLSLILQELTRTHAVAPPRNCRTVRELVESTVSLNFDSLSERCNSGNKHDVWVTLRAIIVEQLGVSPEDVKRDANFVYDLGCN